MYGIFTYIYHRNQPNVGKYTAYASWVSEWSLVEMEKNVSNPCAGNAFFLHGESYAPIPIHSWLFLTFAHMSQGRAAYTQSFCLLKAVGAIQSVSRQVLMPKFKSKQCRSLSRLGFHEKYTGLPCRPGMLLQTQTMDIVWDYIQKIWPNGFLDRPLEIPVQAPWGATFPPLDEISPDLRYKNYLRILKQHRRNQ